MQWSLCVLIVCCFLLEKIMIDNQTHIQPRTFSSLEWYRNTHSCFVHVLHLFLSSLIYEKDCRATSKIRLTCDPGVAGCCCNKYSDGWLFYRLCYSGNSISFLRSKANQSVFRGPKIACFMATIGEVVSWAFAAAGKLWTENTNLPSS